jgi:hypothetical protein
LNPLEPRFEGKGEEEREQEFSEEEEEESNLPPSQQNLKGHKDKGLKITEEDLQTI